MPRTFTLLATLLLASAALAGCALPGGDKPDTTTTTTTPPTSTTTTTPPPTTTTPPVTNETTPLSNSSYTLATSGIPAQVLLGQRFNFTLYANGTREATSDHVGAHFADNTTTPISAATSQACEHASGALPGNFNVSCTISQVGTWYLYGHARGNESNTTYDWWATPVAVKVRNYTLNLTGAPTTPLTSNQTFTLLLNVTGTDNVTSDHIGAHWFNATTTAPTAASSAGACAHLNTGVIDVHRVECSIPNTGTGPKTFYVYGHVRVIEGGVTLNWWSAPVEVQVVGTPVGLPI